MIFSSFRIALMSVVLLLSLFMVGSAEEGVRGEIEASYAKRYQAAELLYLYGMRHGRADDFVSYDENGEQIDMEQFYQNWSALMAQLLSAKWQGKILEFDWLSDQKVRCKVVERFDVVLRDSRYTAQSVAVTASVFEDVWEYRNGAWLQTSSRVLEQKQGRTPYQSPKNGETSDTETAEPGAPKESE